MSTMTATLPEPHAIAAAEDDAPRLLDTYALAYAFVLVWTVPSLLLLGTQRYHVYTFSYIGLLIGPVIAGALSLLLTDRDRGGLASLALRSVLLIAFATVGSIVLIFGGMMTLPLFTGPIATQMGLLAIGAVAGLVVPALPLVWVLLRQVAAGAWLRAAVLLTALVVVAVVTYLVAAPTQLLVESLRKDQVVFLVGSVGWYVPAFAAAAAVVRRVGLA
jgi:asparagine N-glycosylation enzyme membrane subunit Stt3